MIGPVAVGGVPARASIAAVVELLLLLLRILVLLRMPLLVSVPA